MEQRISFHDEINRNKIKSFFLIVIVLGFIVFLGYLISFALSPEYFYMIMFFAVIFSISYTLISYYNSHKIALASVGAKPASQTEHKILFNAVENMSLASGLPMPKVYIMESDQINAFASGRNPVNAVICVTTGALRKLNKQELEGVIAHEMSHIANFDIRFMTLTAVLVGMVAIISKMFFRSIYLSSGRSDKKGGGIILIIAIVTAILAPIAAYLVSFAISRKREFAADATGVKLTRYPPGLRSALEKIKSDSAVSQEDRQRYSKAVAPLFISDPFKSKIAGLFSTHPQIEKRIALLRMM